MLLHSQPSSRCLTSRTKESAFRRGICNKCKRGAKAMAQTIDAPAFDAPPAPLDPADESIASEDIGNVVAFEHVNLEVPDLEIARLFFCEGLGLTLDPSRIGAQRGGMNVLWMNVGKQQFHICKGPVAQKLPTPGSAIGLILPDLPAVAAQLEQLRQLIGNVRVTHITPETLEVIDPHGQCYMVHAHSQFPNFAADRGIAYLRLPCFVGTAAEIARFYNTLLGTPIREGQPMQAEVNMGHPGTKLIFQEREELGSTFSEKDVLSLFSGWHMAFYIGNFSGTYTRLRPVLFNNHPYKDKVHNFKDALKFHQYRFQDIVQLPPSGSVDGEKGVSLPMLYRISHECRSTAHPNFLRCLYNR
ncbi:hypothetical protein DUNSADRAFT_18345 [Dunaliella salina]|uniref:VOC domain-containing protein n=1 Tax=Dunaliella salina TaxID=3046 RepID=A0ABQ7G0F0_DUNSA|nr:hypothetical protein DUNSADRAFT_18345 [Dunaliella salina]|eukprot:KAF5828035.1 hypothetical protein DUNSADRAFT_18345 [Dunaliella salina]